MNGSRDPSAPPTPASCLDIAMIVEFTPSRTQVLTPRKLSAPFSVEQPYLGSGLSDANDNVGRTVSHSELRLLYVGIDLRLAAGTLERILGSSLPFSVAGRAVVVKLFHITDFDPSGARLVTDLGGTSTVTDLAVKLYIQLNNSLT